MTFFLAVHKFVFHSVKLLYFGWKEQYKRNIYIPPKQSWWEVVNCRVQIIFLPPFPVLFHVMESSILYLHKDSTKIRSMVSWRQPLFRPRSPSMNPSEAGATAGGSKNQLRSTSLCCHNRSSCKAFGKSVTTKEHSGLSQAQPLYPLPQTQMRRWGLR